MYLMIVIFFLVIGAILAFISKVLIKGRLERGLGREVEDRELTDIGAWMKATPDPGQSQTPVALQALERKRGDLISLVLGVAGIVLLPLSILEARQLLVPSPFVIVYCIAILLVIIGLPMGLIAFWRARRSFVPDDGSEGRASL